MKGSAILASLGAMSSTSLTSLGPGLVEAVRRGWYLPIRWVEITSKAGGHTAKIMVAQDALQLGEPSDAFRVNVSHTTEQQIVDALGLTMPTDKIADLIHQQASVILKPRMQPDAVSNGTMSTVGAMLRHSREVDAIRGSGGLASTVGKHWILSPKLGARADIGINYGWHDSSAPYRSPGGLPLWQQTGTRHDRFHVDYSQVCVPVHPSCVVDGVTRNLWDVMADPSLAPLVSYEGPIMYRRHPSVPEPEGGVVVASPVSGGGIGGMGTSVVAFGLMALAGWQAAKAVMG